VTEPEDLASFRRKVQVLIRDQAPRIRSRAGFRSPETSEEDRAWRRWRTVLYEAQVLGAHWPHEWGGIDHDDPARDLILSEELARAGLPPLSDQTHLAAFALLRFGTDEQKRQLLPAIRSGQHVWCQLFSEPDAGSDLAAMRSSTVRWGDDYVLTGQKVWSSNAQWAEFGFLLARTDPDAAAGHRGISAFALDMSLPGIDIRPLREITGTTDFNEVFFDQVHMRSDALIGAEGDGWRVAMDSLGAERSGIGAGAIRLGQLVDSLVALAHRLAKPGELDPAVRDVLGRYTALADICRDLVDARLERERHGEASAADVPIGKLVYSELNLAVVEFALRMLGGAALLSEGDPDAVEDGRWQDEFLYARTYTIAGGSSEIMRNILAERVLGMPREARVH
jgi:alkylation response protein AidB-like acyl-CoA dehydrogenase